MNISIRNIKNEELEKLDIKCASCNFWFNCSSGGLAGALDSSNIIEFLRSKLYVRLNNRDRNKNINCFCRYGGKIKGAFKDGRCIGMVLYGKYYLFPNIRSFNVYPPDNDCVFVGCIYVRSGYRGMGIGQRLVMSVERELIKKRIKAIEIIGQRNMDKKQNRELVPVKFLIKNGFYIHKNDSRYPLLRLDLDVLVRDFKLEKVLKKHVLINKRLEVPGRYYNR